MSKRPLPPDQPQRLKALAPHTSVLVQAPAGSGKTDLLTRRFLRLLAEVDDPAEIVAITFTNAAAAEMRHRILGELEKAAAQDGTEEPDDPFSLESLALRALQRSQAREWKLVELPAQLRITTIDAFCREIAIQQPLLTGLGGSLEIAAQPRELYRDAARATLRQIDGADPALRESIEALLSWRDNGWQEMEELLVEMLEGRDRWMTGFVLNREPDWELLRERLERPFAQGVCAALGELCELLDQAPIATEEILELARFTCASIDDYRDLAERAELPEPPFDSTDEIEDARRCFLLLTDFLLTSGEGTLRKTVNKNNGFPADKKKEKERFLQLAGTLRSIDGLEAALRNVRLLPPAQYNEDDWRIVQACFALLRHAAAQLQLAFAESGKVDFTEIAQIAQRVLREEDFLPSDAALAIGDKIKHLLVDEFQDTSRRQHQLLASLIAAWPEREGRSCFAVGDPMQSIYFFRDADAELFARVKNMGLELPQCDGIDNEPLRFAYAPLQANFRTAPQLVTRLNEVFAQVFAAQDGSGVSFSSAQAAREASADNQPRLQLHLEFVPNGAPGRIADPAVAAEKTAAQQRQIEAILALIRSHEAAMRAAQAENRKYRIAVLGRSRPALTPIAEALREAGIPFRAVDLERLQQRPEVIDALALARALASPLHRVEWLGVLRAPWCGLSLAGLHQIAGGEDAALQRRPIPELLAERLDLLKGEDRIAAERLLRVLESLPALRAAQPGISLGSWMQQVWMRLGGAACVNAAQKANLELLWNCLDTLPNGEIDLFGNALQTALDELTAQPDPAASGECGVQLMTIHKSKGLEFEVVIVPELQARSNMGGAGNMLSWLERGLAEANEDGEITEFLIAPLQPKGEERGTAKAFVDRARRDRETQEMRRLLYVAATRAREELHFFARPGYKADGSGDLQLAQPAHSLLKTAWPAFEAEVFHRFEQWKQERNAHSTELASVAASSDSNLLTMPGTLLHRLPAHFSLDALMANLPAVPAMAQAIENNELYARHEGGLLSRALGTAVHALLEEFARLRAHLDADAVRSRLDGKIPAIAAQMRSRGLSPEETERLAVEARQIAVQATRNATGAWILAPHHEAMSEARWTGRIGGALRNLQADRVFKAGTEPLTEGSDCWWIIDYKTAHAASGEADENMPALRKLFAAQLTAYAAVLRSLYGDSLPIRCGLFYPRMELFDWWEDVG